MSNRENIEKFKFYMTRLAVILIIMLSVFMLVIRLISTLREKNTVKTSPDAVITSISAENDKTYLLSDIVSAQDFTVTAHYSDDTVVILNSDEYELMNTELKPIGDYSVITIRLSMQDENENTSEIEEEITCEVKLKMERELIRSLGYCGFPKEKSVEAFLYSNGELVFEGEGDCRTFNRNCFPWQDYDEMDEWPVYSVSFGANVKPISIDNWFEGITTLKYIDSLPDSIKSASEAFMGCTAVERTAAWSQCDNLWNITGMYENCTALKTVTDKMPAGVRVAERTFKDCTSLTESADHSDAESLQYCYQMYANCYSMAKIVNNPVNAISMYGMYAYCINIQSVPAIAEACQNLDSAFIGCVSLETVERIPSNVLTMKSVFEGCSHLDGKLVIDAVSEEIDYQYAFKGAVIASTLNLTGKSKLLNRIGLDAANQHILVRGKEPVEEKVENHFIEKKDDKAQKQEGDTYSNGHFN